MINTIPGWQSVRLLGEGSFGKVYEISREEFGHTQRAALKVITIPRSPSEVASAYQSGMDEQSVTAYFHSFVEELTEEFALMDQLKSNNMNIVGYEDHMVIQHDDGIGWDILIRMELLKPLPKYVSEHPMTETDVIRLGKDMCRALESCRAKGILHRDIKPENIFYSDDTGYFKLGDFGVARVAEKTVGNFSQKGTYHYMAPEVYCGKPYGFAADLYSLGIVLYRYLNYGRLPFLPAYPQSIVFSDHDEALKKRMSGEALPEPQLGSRMLKAVVLQACSYDPKKRFASPGAFLHALEAAEKEYVNAGDDPEQPGGTVGVFGAAGLMGGANADAVQQRSDEEVWRADVHGIQMSESDAGGRPAASSGADRSLRGGNFQTGRMPGESEQQSYPGGEIHGGKPDKNKRFLIFGVVIAVAVVAVVVGLLVLRTRGNSSDSSGGNTSGLASTEFDRDYYYDLLKANGIEAADEESTALTEGLVDTLLGLDQNMTDDADSWTPDADSDGYEISSLMYQILEDAYEDDSESLKNDLLTTVEIIGESQSASSSAGDSGDGSASSSAEDSADGSSGSVGYSDFRDAYEAAVDENHEDENDTTAENAVVYFEAAGIENSWAEISEEIARIEYAIIVSVLKEEMADCEISWLLEDADDDGSEELLICLQDSYSTDSSILLLADADTGELQVSAEPGTAVSSYDSPDLNTVDISGESETLKNKLASYLNTKKTVDDSFEDDYSDDSWEADGIDETIYFLSGAADDWFGANFSDEIGNSSWSDAFDGYEDIYETCIVVADTADGIQAVTTRISADGDSTLSEEDSTSGETSAVNPGKISAFEILDYTFSEIQALNWDTCVTADYSTDDYPDWVCTCTYEDETIAFTFYEYAFEDADAIASGLSLQSGGMEIPITSGISTGMTYDEIAALDGVDAYFSQWEEEGNLQTADGVSEDFAVYYWWEENWCFISLWYSGSGGSAVLQSVNIDFNS